MTDFEAKERELAFGDTAECSDEARPEDVAPVDGVTEAQEECAAPVEAEEAEPMTDAPDEAPSEEPADAPAEALASEETPDEAPAEESADAPADAPTTTKAAKPRRKGGIIAAVSIVAFLLIAGGIVFWLYEYYVPATVTICGTEISTDATELDLSGRGLTNWDTVLLRKCEKLTSLNLADNNITDISQLAKLTELTELDLSGNPLKDLQTLTDAANVLTKLEKVYCSDCGLEDEYLYEVNTALPNTEIIWTVSFRGKSASTDTKELNLSYLSTDISPVKYFSALSVLIIRGNSITDLSPLAGLTELTELDLNKNRITDLSPLAELTELTKLDLSDNSISDLSPLAELTGLTELDLSNNSISDISPLCNLTELTEWKLDGNPLDGLEPLLEAADKLPKLKTVYCSDCGLDNDYLHKIDMSLPDIDIVWPFTFDGKVLTPLIETLDLSCHEAGREITDISALKYCTNLTELDLSLNDITDLSPLADLTELTKLDLHWIFILSDVSPLANLTKLTELNLNSCYVNDISPLANLTELTKLDLTRNYVYDASPLANLTKLTELSLHDTNVADITPLAKLTKLKTLYLGDNDITDISPLAGMTKLTELYLSDNSITDISPLLRLKWLKKLDVENCGLSADEEQQLKDALPGCEIWF